MSNHNLKFSVAQNIRKRQPELTEIQYFNTGSAISLSRAMYRNQIFYIVSMRGERFALSSHAHMTIQSSQASCLPNCAAAMDSRVCRGSCLSDSAQTIDLVSRFKSTECARAMYQARADTIHVITHNPSS